MTPPIHLDYSLQYFLKEYGNISDDNNLTRLSAGNLQKQPPKVLKNYAEPHISDDSNDWINFPPDVICNHSDPRGCV